MTVTFHIEYTIINKVIGRSTYLKVSAVTIVGSVIGIVVVEGDPAKGKGPVGNKGRTGIVG